MSSVCYFIHSILKERIFGMHTFGNITPYKFNITAHKVTFPLFTFVKTYITTTTLQFYLLQRTKKTFSSPCTSICWRALIVGAWFLLEWSQWNIPGYGDSLSLALLYQKMLWKGLHRDGLHPPGLWSSAALSWSILCVYKPHPNFCVMCDCHWDIENSILKDVFFQMA